MEKSYDVTQKRFNPLVGDDPQVRAWREMVLDKEGLSQDGWTLVHGEPYCWAEGKEIMIYPDTKDYLFLHEVAHALYPYPETLGLGKHFHGSQHASTFGKLVDKYMETRKVPRALPPVAMVITQEDPDAAQGGPFLSEAQGEGPVRNTPKTCTHEPENIEVIRHGIYGGIVNMCRCGNCGVQFERYTGSDWRPEPSIVESYVKN